MACCALAVLILVQVFAPVRRVRVLLGLAADAVNPETNWQPFQTGAPAPARARQRLAVRPLIAIQCLLLVVLLSLHLHAPEAAAAPQWIPLAEDEICSWVRDGGLR